MYCTEGKGQPTLSLHYIYNSAGYIPEFTYTRRVTYRSSQIDNKLGKLHTGVHTKLSRSYTGVQNIQIFTLGWSHTGVKIFMMFT